MRAFPFAALIAIVATAAGCTVETVVQPAPENEQETKSAVLSQPQIERKGPELAREFDRKFDQNTAEAALRAPGIDTSEIDGWGRHAINPDLDVDINRVGAGVGNAEIRQDRTQTE